MPKKKSTAGQKSQGIHAQKPQRTRTSVGMKRLLNQLDAYKKGKRVVLKMPTASNPSISEKVEATQLWGSPFTKRKNES